MRSPPDTLPRAKPPDATGPLSFMNPTVYYEVLPQKKAQRTQNVQAPAKKTSKPAPPSPPRHVYHLWRSRDNRKGRHTVVVSRSYYRHHLRRRDHGLDRTARRAAALRATNSLRETLHGISKMATCWPVWDLSYEIAVLFTLGSVVWVVNGFFVWLPLQAPSTAFARESATGGGVTALVGASIFSIGALLGLVEAVNENRTDCCGWALEEAIDSDKSGILLLRPRPDTCQHRQARRWRRLLGGAADARAGHVDANVSDTDVSETAVGPTHHRQLSWCPSRHELRRHYLLEIGFWACAVQMVAANIFWISGFTGLPGILDRFSVAATDGIFWLPQVVGGTGFVVASLLFMLETQPHWYMPALGVLGWHIGFWNLVGSLGFLLCGAFGFASSSPDMEYASALTSFIGSWAFLIGSVIQWYESLDKYPVVVANSAQGRPLD